MLPDDEARPVDEPVNWESWFAWLERPSLHPLADYECRTCGELNCREEHNGER